MNEGGGSFAKSTALKGAFKTKPPSCHLHYRGGKELWIQPYIQQKESNETGSRVERGRGSGGEVCGWTLNICGLCKASLSQKLDQPLGLGALEALVFCNANASLPVLGRRTAFLQQEPLGTGDWWGRREHFLCQLRCPAMPRKQVALTQGGGTMSPGQEKLLRAQGRQALELGVLILPCLGCVCVFPTQAVAPHLCTTVYLNVLYCRNIPVQSRVQERD